MKIHAPIVEQNGDLVRYTVFPDTGLYHRYHWLGRIGESTYTVEILDMAREHGRRRLAVAAWIGLQQARIKKALRSLVRFFIPTFRRWR